MAVSYRRETKYSPSTKLDDDGHKIPQGYINHFNKMPIITKDHADQYLEQLYRNKLELSKKSYSSSRIDVRIKETIQFFKYRKQDVTTIVTAAVLMSEFESRCD